MKQRIAALLCACGLLLTGCGAQQAQPAPTAQPSPTAQPVIQDYPWEFAWQEGDIEALKTPCERQGTVVTVEYDTPAYAVNDLLGKDETLHKRLRVYLPYGYDESRQYNVLYLLHGTKYPGDGEMEEYWLDQWGEQTLPVLDNMIDQGLCEPVIVVTPTYYSRVEGCPLGSEQVEELARRLDDRHISGQGKGDDREQNIWPQYFGQELRNNIIPAVEGKFSTYAGGDTGEESLIASRDHRAFAGLSRGSMTVCRSGLTQNADIIAWFGSYSGAWQEFDTMKEALEGEFAAYPIRFWYNGNGVGDFALPNHEEFRDLTLEQLGDRFVDGENYAFVTLTDGAHRYESWIADLYNSLLVFFR